MRSYGVVAHPVRTNSPAIMQRHPTIFLLLRRRRFFANCILIKLLMPRWPIGRSARAVVRSPGSGLRIRQPVEKILSIG